MILRADYLSGEKVQAGNDNADSSKSTVQVYAWCLIFADGLLSIVISRNMGELLSGYNASHARV